MSNEHTNIHEFDFNLICEYFSLIERQGPGSSDTTIKALNFIDNLTAQSAIVDLGCGTGGQTMTLAQVLEGDIIGIDLFPGFVDKFNENAATLNVQHRIKAIVGSMDNLPFEPESLDLIWSEGAIYNIGFERGINEWRSYLKKGAYIAVSEASWFSNERPVEIQAFWEEAYPEIDTISAKIEQIQKAGYIPIATFCLPENCWTKNFYEPQVLAQEQFLKKYSDNRTARELIANERREAALYEKYKEYYGYVFYIAKKI
jgi:SAM-dependent methyltransferase